MADGLLTRARKWLGHKIMGEHLDVLVENEAHRLVEDERMWRSVEDIVDGPFRERPSTKGGRIEEGDTFADIADEDRGWRRISDSSTDLGLEKLKGMMSQSRWLYYRNPIARNIVRNYVFLIAGSGVSLQFPKKQETWDAWASANNWPRRSLSIIRSTLLYGTWPVVLFPVGVDTRVLHPKGKETEIIPDESRKRSKNDLCRVIRGFDPRGIVEFNTDPNDSETVLSVVRETSIGELSSVKIRYSGEDMVVFRHDTVGSSALGRPLLEPVFRPLQWYHAFLRDRVILNGMRTRIPIVRNLDRGGQTNVTTQAARFSNMPRPASVLTTGKGETWTFPSMNINSGDASADANLLRQYIASGVNLPEFLVTMSAETGNRASLQEATDQMKPMIDEMQSQFGDGFEDIGEAIVGERPKAVWPEGEKRQSAEQIRGYSQAIGDNYLSRQVAAALLGYNWKVDIFPQLLEEHAMLEDAGLISQFGGGFPPFGGGSTDPTSQE